MSYEYQIERKALKFIQKQSEDQQRRIYAAIYKLPDAGDRKDLKGRKGIFRLRIGPYRIIYTVDHGKLIVHVVDADNRGDIYKRY